MHRFLLFLTLFISLAAYGQADPTKTTYSYAQCCGSAMPYPTPEVQIEVADSLTPVMINHVGRHGARFPSSPKHTLALMRALAQADSAGTITASGRDLLALTRYVDNRCHNYWGALDSLGMAEQRGIASRMFLNYPMLFKDGRIEASSSYVPRCMMSMYEFTHQLDRLNNRIEVYTNSGRQNSMLLRPFDLSAEYTDYVKSKVWETPYNDVMAIKITPEPLKRILGTVDGLSRKDIEELTRAEYAFIGSLSAMSVAVDYKKYFTLEEFNDLWNVFNLSQYLLHSTTTLSAAPSDAASALLLDFIRTTDSFIAGDSAAKVRLRFGHAETLMPFFSLLHLNGAYYLTNYFDTVGAHWRDFEIVPMAANLQMILCKNSRGGYVVRFDLNERPVSLIPGDSRIYIPWSEARAYMVRCLPLIDQP